jgi:hypothetical protein
MIQVRDNLNNQFMFFDYLASINSSISLFLENNNYQLNYYCTYNKKVNNIHQIVTSNTIKKVDNGYRIIVIEEVDEIVNTYVVKTNNNLIIYYENLVVSVSGIYSKNVIKTYGFFIFDDYYELIVGGILDTFYEYNRDVDENCVNTYIGSTLSNNNFKIVLYKNLK